VCIATSRSSTRHSSEAFASHAILLVIVKKKDSG
jgi:hypothetical protein